MTTIRSELLGNGGSYEGIGEMYVVVQEVNYKNHPHYVAILLLVEENELPKVGQNEDPIGMSERQPIVRSKLLGNGGSYEGIQRVILVAHEMDYKNHPHFTTIRRLVEEKELSKVRQNEGPWGSFIFLQDP